MSARFDSALVLDDLMASRRWLRESLLEAFPGIAVQEAATLSEALAGCTSAPAIALIDLGLPDGSGLQLIEALRERGATTVCVVATVFDDDAHLFPALRAGAEGYVLKDLPRTDLARLLQGIASGQPPLSPSIARRLLRHFAPTPEPQPAASALTARETEVLRLIAKGLTVPEAARTLGLSRHTLAGYVKDIYRKLSVGSRAEATLEASRLGLL